MNRNLATSLERSLPYWQQANESLQRSRGSSSCLAFSGRVFFLLGVDLHLLVFNIQPEMVVDAHVLVGHPDQGKKSDQVSSPVVVEQPESCEDQEGCGDVVAEAVFASE